MLLSFLFLILSSSISWAAGNVLVIVGDSITEGLGVAKDQAFPALLENQLTHWKVISSGINGSTSAGAAPRMRQVLQDRPSAVLLALGGNDGMRGLAIEKMRENLREALREAKTQGVKVLLAGAEAPPSHGASYKKSFREAFSSLASEESIPYYGDLMSGVYSRKNLLQADGTHPNPEGHRELARLILPFLKRQLY